MRGLPDIDTLPPSHRNVFQTTRNHPHSLTCAICLPFAHKCTRSRQDLISVFSPFLDDPTKLANSGNVTPGVKEGGEGGGGGKGGEGGESKAGGAGRESKGNDEDDGGEGRDLSALSRGTLTVDTMSVGMDHDGKDPAQDLARAMQCFIFRFSQTFTTLCDVSPALLNAGGLFHHSRGEFGVRSIVCYPWLACLGLPARLKVRVAHLGTATTKCNWRVGV